MFKAYNIIESNNEKIKMANKLKAIERRKYIPKDLNIDITPNKLNELTLMNNILYFVENVMCVSPKFNTIDFNMYIDMMTNSSLYYFKYIDTIIDHYNKNGENKSIIIVDGKNLSHNTKFLINNSEIILRKFGIEMLELCKNLDKKKSTRYDIIYNNVLQTLLPEINQNYYYIIVITRDNNISDIEYRPFTDFSSNVVRCNIDCTSSLGNKCYIDYKNDETDDYLCLLLYNTLYNSEYKDNVFGILTLDNYSWCRLSWKRINTQQLYKH